jgi:hypothetical protein
MKGNSILSQSDGAVRSRAKADGIECAVGRAPTFARTGLAGRLTLGLHNSAMPVIAGGLTNMVGPI